MKLLIVFLQHVMKIISVTSFGLLNVSKNGKNSVEQLIIKITIIIIFLKASLMKSGLTLNPTYTATLFPY